MGEKLLQAYVVVDNNGQLGEQIDEIQLATVAGKKVNRFRQCRANVKHSEALLLVDIFEQGGEQL